MWLGAEGMDGLPVKITYCFGRGPRFDSKHLLQVAYDSLYLHFWMICCLLLASVAPAYRPGRRQMLYTQSKNRKKIAVI